jgi:hypothetical protein
LHTSIDDDACFAHKRINARECDIECAGCLARSHQRSFEYRRMFRYGLPMHAVALREGGGAVYATTRHHAQLRHIAVSRFFRVVQLSQRAKLV